MRTPNKADLKPGVQLTARRPNWAGQIETIRVLSVHSEYSRALNRSRTYIVFENTNTNGYRANNCPTRRNDQACPIFLDGLTGTIYLRQIKRDYLISE